MDLTFFSAPLTPIFMAFSTPTFVWMKDEFYQSPYQTRYNYNTDIFKDDIHINM